MSWAAITARKPEADCKNVVTFCKVSKEPKSNNKWTDVDTCIKFLPKNAIISVLQPFFFLALADLISEYAVFFLDLSLWDLDECYRLKPSKKECVQDLPKTFGIDGGNSRYINDPSMRCEIEMTSAVELSVDETQPKFINEILFYNKGIFGMWSYKISLEFLKNHIVSLIKIDNFEDFVSFLKDIFEKNKKRLNPHAIEHRHSHAKFREMWEVWRKIFGPRIIYYNLRNLAEF